MLLVSSSSCLCPVHWSPVLGREWRCSWSSADRRCSKYIWVITKCVAYKGATYITDLTVCYIFQRVLCVAVCHRLHSIRLCISTRLSCSTKWTGMCNSDSRTVTRLRQNVFSTGFQMVREWKWPEKPFLMFRHVFRHVSCQAIVGLLVTCIDAELVIVCDCNDCL